MKLKVNRSFLIGAAVLFAVAGLAGCGRGAETAKPNTQVNKENAEMRTVVPLTRPIALDKAGEVVNLEFEVPPPGPNAVPYLMLGLRMENPDSGEAAALSSKIVGAKLSARIRLLRVEQGAITSVALTKVMPNLSDRVPVPIDGKVQGVVTTSVDSTLLADAGLLDPNLFYEMVKFAEAEKIQPGHYRLTIEMLDEHPEFEADKVELLVAYFKKPK